MDSSTSEPHSRCRFTHFPRDGWTVYANTGGAGRCIPKSKQLAPCDNCKRLYAAGVESYKLIEAKKDMRIYYEDE